MRGLFFHLFRKHHEDGFILPLTLVIIFLLSAFLLHEIKMYEAEKRFLHSSEDMFQLDQLMQMANVDLEGKLSHSGPRHGVLDYKIGTVRYSVDLYKGNVLRITLKAVTNDGGMHISHAYYDKIKQKMIRWGEDV